MLLAAGASAIPYGAMAQERARAAGAGQPEQAGGEVTEVVVTGTRIARAGYDTLEPATTIDAGYLENRGTTNIAEALTTMPSFATGQTPQGNQGTFNAGQSFVDRFGLGSARTLTLVNGRRFVSTNAPSRQGNVVGTPAPAGLQVDLNVIPSLMIERIDNLSIGGAPAYGSDAIAGVVNIILRTRYEGLKVSANTGITARNDNFRANLSALAGRNFAEGRGNVMIAGSYDRSDGLLSSSRERVRRAYSYQQNPLATSAAARIAGRTPQNDGRVNTSVPFNTGNTDGIPNSVLIENARVAGMTAGGVVLGPTGFLGADLRVPAFGPTGVRLQFDNSGNLVPYNPGNPFTQTYASGGDGFPLYTTDPLLADVERYTFNANASFDVNDHMKLFVESIYYKGIARELIDQAAYNSPLFGDRTISTGAMLFAANDPRLNANAQALLTSVGIDRFQLSRTWTDLGSGASRSNNEVFRVVGGLTDKFDFVGRDFTLEASVNFGRTNGNYYQTEVIQQNFVNALNAKRDAAGQIVCDPNPAFNAAPGALRPVADAACVVLDPFGNSRRSQAALDYVTDITHATSRLEQTVASINVSTPALLDLWAGPIGFSVGFEARREFGAFTPDRAQLSGQTRNAAVAAASGKFTTREVFGELAIPLISEDNGIPLVHSLEFETRGRYVDNSVNGGFVTYTAGGRYQPIRDLTFRGNFTRSLRAPAIVELFMPQSTSPGFFPDPCDSINIASGTAPAIRQRNCAAFYSAYGINPALGFNSVARSAVVPNLVGGNQDLKNESANAYTFGFVVTPPFLTRLSIAVDWNRIKVKDNIVALSSADIAQGCYDNPDFDASNPDAGNAFCTLFTREHGGDRNGQIVADPLNPGIRTTYINGGYMSFKALTATANLRDIDTGLFGTTLALNSNFYYLDELCSSNNLVTVTCNQGTTGNPRWTAQVGAVVSKGPVSVFTEINYRPSTKYDLTFNQETRDILSIDSMTTVNAGVSYNLESASVRLTISNLLDAKPPWPSTTGDMLGRRFLLSVSKSF